MMRVEVFVRFGIELRALCIPTGPIQQRRIDLNIDKIPPSIPGVLQVKWGFMQGI
jgi:hypothetical protein